MNALLRKLWKITVGPLRYGIIKYRAEDYWRDRYKAHGMNLRGSGDESKTEADNFTLYWQGRERVKALCKLAGVNLSTARVLDIGCGNGQFTELCYEEGAVSYVGLDITDQLFPALRKRYPCYWFAKCDVTQRWITDWNTTTSDGSDAIWPSPYNLLLCVDVIEHITSRAALARALANVRSVMDKDSTLIIGPVMPQGGKRLFYFHPWTGMDVMEKFKLVDMVEFKGGHLLALKLAQKENL